MKDNIKKAFESAEQEIQEREIARLKEIVKDLLRQKNEKEQEKREIEKEISVIKQTLDDFKAGRLDKVKDLIEKDSTARDVLPFQIHIINQPVIQKPWTWQYDIVQNVQPLVGNGTWTTTAASLNCLTTSGTTAANFTTGTYVIGDGKIINL